MKILLPLLVGIPLLALGIALRPPTVPHLGRDNTDSSSVAASHRIVSYASVLEALATIDDSTNRIVAAPDHLRLGVQRSLISKVFPALASIAPVGNSTTPDPEGILALNADTVIAWRGILGNLRQIGFPNILQVRQPGAEVGPALNETWELLGKVLGKQARSNILIDAYHQKMKTIATEHAVPLRVIVIIPIRGHWRIGGGRFYLNSLLNLVGAENAATAEPANGPADAEQILNYDPDVILLLNTPGGASPAELYTNRIWHAVPAVRQRRVYTMPTRSTYNAPVDEPLLTQWLIDILHSERNEEQTRENYATTYMNVYNYSLSNADLAWALRDEENKASAGYARFLGTGRSRLDN
jgi:iron complex transport system substrate-binding protein